MRNSSRDHDPLQIALKQSRWRPEQAKLIVDAWKASGQSMDAFTEKHAALPSTGLISGPKGRKNRAAFGLHLGKTLCVLQKGVLEKL